MVKWRIDQMQDQLVFKVKRFDPDQDHEGRYDSFKIPRETNSIYDTLFFVFNPMLQKCSLSLSTSHSKDKMLLTN